jgi:hypothetical protein
MSKQVTENKGKLTIKGERTAKDEDYILRKRVIALQEKNREYERTHEFVRVKVLNGYRMVEKSKYEKTHGNTAE